jgi:hypothetical protein
MITAASVSARRRASSSSGIVPGSTDSTSSPCTIGSPLADQQPDMAVTPGITSVGKRCASRTWRCM